MALKTLDELNRDFLYERLLNVELKRDDMSDWDMDLDLNEERIITGVTQKFVTAYQTFKSFAGRKSFAGWKTVGKAS